MRPGEINELIEMNIYCRNGRVDRHENGLPEKISRPEVDYALTAYSLFDEEIEGFLARMIDIAREGIFIVFRGSPPGTLSEFAYGPRPQADCLCLYNILKDMGHQFDVILFPRDYHLPLEMVQNSIVSAIRRQNRSPITCGRKGGCKRGRTDCGPPSRPKMLCFI